MNIPIATMDARASFARTNLAALFALAAVLLLLLAGVGIFRWHAGQPPAPTPTVAPGAPQVVAVSPRWQADLLTAYHAARYLLDPRV